jgi:hypothetical protein
MCLQLNDALFSAAPRAKYMLRLYDTMLNFVENLLENERGPMNDQDLTKTDYDPDRSLVLIEGLSHFLTNFLQNLASCQTSFTIFICGKTHFENNLNTVTISLTFIL